MSFSSIISIFVSYYNLNMLSPKHKPILFVLLQQWVAYLSVRTKSTLLLKPALAWNDGSDHLTTAQPVAVG